MAVSRQNPDAIVIGAGLIGLAVARALARQGASVVVLDDRRSGAASPAAAGMLAPTVEPLAGAALDFAIASRERFPEYVRELEAATGIGVSLDRRGILELAHSNQRADALRASAAGRQGLEWLEPEDVGRLEPSLAPVLGAVLHSNDGAVDNVRLLDALERAIGADPRVQRLDAAASSLSLADRGGTVGVASLGNLESPLIVLAAGAWSTRIQGLPRTLPIEPARGQMLSVAAATLGHVVYGEHAYLVPREGRTLVGATMERVGFDASTTESALAVLERRGEEIVPALSRATRAAAWAGLRPMTPDGLPIIGADPDWPALLYAAGHSRNGVLMAPLTGDVIAAIAGGQEPSFDLAPFDVQRFTRTAGPGTE